MRNTEILALSNMGTLQPDRSMTASRYVLRGLVWLFSGIGLMVQLYSMNTIMAHHWSAPRHWLGKICYLESTNSTMDHHPDGHALEEKILQFRSRQAPVEQIRRLEQEERELRRFPDAVPLVALVPIGVGITYLVLSFSRRKHPHDRLSRGDEALKKI